MFNLIRKLQHKPEASRRTIAFGAALSITIFVIVVWLSTVGFRFDTEAQERTDTAPSPFETFAHNVSKLFSGTSEFQRTIDTVSSSVNNIYLETESGSTTTSTEGYPGTSTTSTTSPLSTSTTD